VGIGGEDRQGSEDDGLETAEQSLRMVVVGHRRCWA
jgi:hypothetical protein